MHVRSKCYPAVLKTFERKKLPLEFDDPNLLYYLPKEKALNLKLKQVELSFKLFSQHRIKYVYIFRVPEGFQSRSLTDSDVAIANDMWKFNHFGSLFYLQRLARLNKSCGILTANGDCLVSSGFQ